MSRIVDAMRPDREPTNGSCRTLVTRAATDMTLNVQLERERRMATAVSSSFAPDTPSLI